MNSIKENKTQSIGKEQQRVKNRIKLVANIV